MLQAVRIAVAELESKEGKGTGLKACVCPGSLMEAVPKLPEEVHEISTPA